jgi:CHAT domain-containing protein
MLPFDLARAYALYRSLFGQVEDLIQDKQLLIVPSGPLTALPFQVLVTGKPSAAIPSDMKAYASAQWFAQRNPMAVLPSVSSLKALRRHAGASAGAAPYIGFGNPLLTGPSGNDRSAWAVQSCQAPSRAHALIAQARGLARPFSELYKPDGGADVEALRRQPPLPDTADELCAVARLTGASPEESVYLGARATEARVSALSAQRALSKVRVVHFATHGLVAGETEAIARTTKAEPALLLTPPVAASEEDDGLLTASEVAALKLDADWVILSACNTAAGGEKGAEALSGLARAFFYAGARALLVSHWYVDSAATVELVTGAFGEMRVNPALGRAEALRRAMVSLIARGDRSAHPSVWAPFVVVGEGGAVK